MRSFLLYFFVLSPSFSSDPACIENEMKDVGMYVYVGLCVCILQFLFSSYSYITLLYASFYLAPFIIIVFIHSFIYLFLFIYLFIIIYIFNRVHVVSSRQVHRMC